VRRQAVKLEFTSEFLGVVVEFRTAFSKRSWPYMLAVTLPWLIQQGQRSVRGLTAGAGLAVHESNFYRFFSEFKFNTELFSRILFNRIVSAFKLSEIMLVVDDTLCPKWGRRIFGTASFFDHVARPRPGFIWGHNWVVLAIIVELFGVPVAIPFWVRLYRPRSSCPAKEFRTRLQIAAEAIRRVKTWSSLHVKTVGDGAYNNKSLLTPLAKLGVPLVSRLRNDARLREDPPKGNTRKQGRRAKYGPFISRLPDLAKNTKGWHELVPHMYGKDVTVKVKSFDAWWPKAGVKLRVVITRDPDGKRKPCYLSSTDLNMTPKDIIEIFAKRWSIEQMFSDAKNELGLDTAEVRLPKSVERHAVLAFGFVAVVRLWALSRFARTKQPPTSFRRQLSALREEILVETIFKSQAPRPGSRRNAEALAGLLAPGATA
jgi:hypothetical protein